MTDFIDGNMDISNTIPQMNKLIKDTNLSINEEFGKEMSVAIMWANRALGEMLRTDKIDIGSITNHLQAIGDIYNKYFPVTHVNIVSDDRAIEDWAPGDIGKTSHYEGEWAFCCPNGCGIVAMLDQKMTPVTEHDDHTISVSYLFHGCMGYINNRLKIDHNRIIYQDKS